MFKPPHTQPLRVLQHHRRMQERPAKIVSKADSQRYYVVYGVPV